MKSPKGYRHVMREYPKGVRISLNRKHPQEITFNDDVTRLFLGGRGLGVYTFLREVGLGVEPFSPKNALVFASGVLTGTRFPATARSVLVSRSPQTRTISSSNIGGRWGVTLRKTGYDVMVVTGHLEDLHYLYFNGEEMRIEPCDNLRGKTPHETEKALKKKYPKAAIISIGLAGEKGVVFASITHDLEHDFGRGGLGAVMGSKNLKAIVIEGDKEIPIANQAEHESLAKKMTERLKGTQPYHLYHEFGTKHYISVFTELNGITVNHYHKNHDPETDNLLEFTFKPYEIKQKACARCVVACRHTYNINGKKVYTPEFESIITLGPNLGEYEFKKLVPLVEKVTELGMDAISTGQVIATLVELARKGKIKDTKGMHLDFGSLDIANLMELIATKKGIGKDLAKGSVALEKQYQETDIATHVKGMDFPAYDPRQFTGLAIGYAVSPRGACHLRGGASIGVEALKNPIEVDRKTWNGKGRLVGFTTKVTTLMDTLGACVHTYHVYTHLHVLARILPNSLRKALTSRAPRIALQFFDVKPMAQAVSSVLGENISSHELLRVAQRVLTLERLYNISAGFTIQDDYLPERFYQESTDTAPKIPKHEFERELKKYYRVMGWDKHGYPKQKTIEKLGIQGIIKTLSKGK